MLTEGEFDVNPPHPPALEQRYIRNNPRFPGGPALPAKSLLALAFSLLAGAEQWSLRNANIATPGSFCYDGRPENCRLYGRLYTWDAAQQACPSLGKGWRLPSDAEWRQLASRHGGGQALHRQTGGEKQRAFSVRCIRD